MTLLLIAAVSFLLISAESRGKCSYPHWRFRQVPPESRQPCATRSCGCEAQTSTT